MPLYTFILEFKGGTYISQVRAKTYKSAPKIWATKLDVAAIQGLKEQDRVSLLDTLKQDNPTPIRGITNTWCCDSLIRNELAGINFIQTSE